MHTRGLRPADTNGPKGSGELRSFAQVVVMSASADCVNLDQGNRPGVRSMLGTHRRT